jgi:hypothetical protein
MHTTLLARLMLYDGLPPPINANRLQCRRMLASGESKNAVEAPWL